MLLTVHHDATLARMRTTVTLADDVAAAVDRLRRERGVGLSEAVNELIRDGLVRGRTKRGFRQRTADVGLRMNIDNVGDVLELLDEPSD
jgi:hypothetical protein